jgi:hypothetical protein
MTGNKILKSFLFVGTWFSTLSFFAQAHTAPLEDEVLTPLNRYHGYLISGARVDTNSQQSGSMKLKLHAIAGFNQCENENMVSSVKPVVLPAQQKVVLSISQTRINPNLSCPQTFDPVFEEWETSFELPVGYSIEFQTNSLAFGTVRMFGGNNARIGGLALEKNSKVFDSSKTQWRALQIESMFELQTTCDSTIQFKGFSYLVNNELWSSVQRRTVPASGCDNLETPISVPVKHIATYPTGNVQSVRVVNTSSFNPTIEWPSWAD